MTFIWRSIIVICHHRYRHLATDDCIVHKSLENLILSRSTLICAPNKFLNDWAHIRRRWSVILTITETLRPIINHPTTNHT
jgi:hypothetical protein